MPNVIEYQKMIRRNCLKCQGGAISGIALCKAIGCPFHTVRMEMPGTQSELFSEGYRQRFIEDAVSVAFEMPERFWYSELRGKIERQYGGVPHPNWWGKPLINALQKRGFRRTDQYRKSIRKSRKGGDEWLWERIAMSNAA